MLQQVASLPQTRGLTKPRRRTGAGCELQQSPPGVGAEAAIALTLSGAVRRIGNAELIPRLDGADRIEIDDAVLAVLVVAADAVVRDAAVAALPGRRRLRSPAPGSDQHGNERGQHQQNAIRSIRHTPHLDGRSVASGSPNAITDSPSSRTILSASISGKGEAHSRTVHKKKGARLVALAPLVRCGVLRSEFAGDRSDADQLAARSVRRRRHTDRQRGIRIERVAEDRGSTLRQAAARARRAVDGERPTLDVESVRRQARDLGPGVVAHDEGDVDQVVLGRRAALVDGAARGADSAASNCGGGGAGSGASGRSVLVGFGYVLFATGSSARCWSACRSVLLLTAYGSAPWWSACACALLRYPAYGSGARCRSACGSGAP